MSSRYHRLLITYTKQLASHVNQGRHQQALTLYGQMRASPDLTLDPFVFPLTLKSCSALGLPLTVCALHAHTIKAGLLSNPFVASALVDSYGKCVSINFARQLFEEVPQRNAVVWNSMISLYSHSNDVASAMRLFDLMDVAPVASTYNSIIAALTAAEESDVWSSRALDFYRRMQVAAVKPNLITVLVLLPACVGVAALNLVREIQGFGMRSSIHLHPHLVSGLVEAYGRCGCLNYACRIFNRMEERDVVAWSSMVSAYAFNGEAEAAMSTFRQMEVAGVHPDRIMFLGVLKACSHAGLADEALRYFELMTKNYAMEVGSDHYACLVDVLGRAGRLYEAYELIQGMPMEATPKAWGALLSACRSYGEVGLAEVAGRVLIEMEPENAGNFVLLASVYAGAGKFEEALRVRREMKERGARRAPGGSWFISQNP